MGYYRRYNKNRRYPSHRNYHRRSGRISVGEGLGRVAWMGAKAGYKAARTGYRAYRTARTAVRVGYRIAKAPFQIGKEIYKGFKR
jgi:hypothetical protein